jgi:hypothetical protein
VKVVTSPETIHAAMDVARKQAIADCARIARDYADSRNRAGVVDRAAAAKLKAAIDIAQKIEKLGAR